MMAWFVFGDGDQLDVVILRLCSVIWSQAVLLKGCLCHQTCLLQDIPKNSCLAAMCTIQAGDNSILREKRSELVATLTEEEAAARAALESLKAVSRQQLYKLHVREWYFVKLQCRATEAQRDKQK